MRIFKRKKKVLMTSCSCLEISDQSYCQLIRYCSHKKLR